MTRDYSLAAGLELAGDDATELECAVAQLYGTMRPSVCRYVRSILRDPDAAEDLTQEVFLRLYRHVREGHSVRDARSWLFRVAHNLAMDRVRVQSELPFAKDATECFTAPEANAEERLLQGERRSELAAAIDSLSPRERQCIELRAEGLVYREIAEVLGIRPSSVVTFLARAIKKLAEANDA
jgi:RNA polymerase sigma-70 factor (ECF subfamily)